MTPWIIKAIPINILIIAGNIIMIMPKTRMMIPVISGIRAKPDVKIGHSPTIPNRMRAMPTR